MRQVVVYGAGGHAKVVADIVLSSDGMDLVGFVDDADAPPGTVLGKPVLGNGAWLQRQRGLCVALGIGDNRVRRLVAERCEAAGLEIVTVLHPRAIVSRSARIGVGTVVMAAAVVNPDAELGPGVILNTAAVAEHDVVLGAYAHLSPNTALGGAAKVGTMSHLGVGVSVLPLVRIGDNTTVGAGAVVHRDLPDDVVAVGVPARVIRQKGKT